MRRGITLLELAIVLAIVGLMAGMSYASLQGVKSRTTFSSVTNEVVTALRKTRVEALSRGTYTAFVVDTNAGSQRYWGIQTDAPASVAAFDPASCVSPGCVMIVQGRIPEGVVDFGPAAGYGSALPAPFTGIPTGGTLTRKYCSFCQGVTAPAAGWGYVVFAPGGQVQFSGSSGTIGEQLTLTSTRDNVTRIATVSVVSRTGLIDIHSK